MIDLYAAPTANGLRAKIMLDECESPYTLHKVDIGKGEHKLPSFLNVNPRGLLPALVDSDGPGGASVSLSQSTAILLYLGEKTGKFIPADPVRRAAVYEALMDAASDVAQTFSGILWISRSKEPHRPTQEIFESRFKGYLKSWNAMLAKQQYCAGDEITIADFGLYPVYARCKQLSPVLTEGCSDLDRWERELSARSGTKRGMSLDIPPAVTAPSKGAPAAEASLSASLKAQFF